MLDFFAIFSKGGIVLWCFQGAGVTESFAGPVNALIRSVILQERSGTNSYNHNSLSMKYKLDNEFELVFVVGFQKILTLTYVDKFIDDVQLHFRDRYKNELEQRGALKLLSHSFEFEDAFHLLLREAEESGRARGPVSMKTFKESQKSQKTVKSMIETKGGDKGKEPNGKKNKNAKKEAPPADTATGDLAKVGGPGTEVKRAEDCNQGLTPDEMIQRKREEFFRKRMGGTITEKPSKSPKPQKPREKKKQEWGNSYKKLDYSNANGNGSHEAMDPARDATTEMGGQLDSMEGDLRSVDYESSEEGEQEEEEEEEEEERVAITSLSKERWAHHTHQLRSSH